MDAAGGKAKNETKTNFLFFCQAQSAVEKPLCTT